MENIIKEAENVTHSNGRYCRGSGGTSRENNRKSDSFFSRPHLDVFDVLRGQNLSVTISGRNEVDEPTPDETYEIIVWKLQVKNKLESVAQFGEDCSVKIYWNFVKREGNLSWKVVEEPTRTSVNTNPMPLPYIHNKLRDLIGAEYALELQLTGETELTIPQGGSEELYLLLTIRNHEYAYPITKFSNNDLPKWSKDTKIYVMHVRGKPFYIKIGEKREFGIRFGCVGYSDRRYEQYTLEVKSWDDIQVDNV